jgi:hypothetical protein
MVVAEGCSMRVTFWKSKSALEEKVSAERLGSLKQACEELGRRDLYEPLSWVLNLNIRWLDSNLEYFLKRKRYIVAANVMLYEAKIERARGCLEAATRLAKTGSARHRRLTTILANLDIVAKIARRFWEIEGKYATTKKKRYPELSAKPPGK